MFPQNITLTKLAQIYYFIRTFIICPWRCKLSGGANVLLSLVCTVVRTNWTSRSIQFEWMHKYLQVGTKCQTIYFVSIMHLCVKCQSSQLNTVIFGNSWWTAKYQLASDAWIKAVCKHGGKISTQSKRRETTLRFVQKRRVLSQYKGVSMKISALGGTQLWALCIMHWRSYSKVKV